MEEEKQARSRSEHTAYKTQQGSHQSQLLRSSCRTGAVAHKSLVTSSLLRTTATVVYVHTKRAIYIYTGIYQKSEIA